MRAPLEAPGPFVKRNAAAWKIVAQYAVFACIWIGLSDQLVAWLFNDVRSVALAGTFKGWFFVAVTSLLLFVLISRLIADFNHVLDTVQRKDAELLEVARSLEESQRMAGLGSFELDLTDGRWRSSALCDELLGIDASFARTARGWKSLVHPQDWPVLKQQFSVDMLQNGLPMAHEYRIIRPSDGAVRWLRAFGRVEPAQHGRSARVLGSFLDITAQHLAQTEIAAVNNKMRATLGALPDLLFEVGADGRIHAYHSHRDDLLAAPPELFLGRRMTEVLPPEAAAVCSQAIVDATAKGYSTGHRYALDLPQGQRWFELSVAPMDTMAQADQRFIMIARDVTERRAAEEKMELSARVFSHAREGIMVADAQGLLVDVNAAFTRITGYTREEVIGHNPAMLGSGRQGKEFYRAMWTELMQAGFWTGEVWNRRKDGEVYAELLTISVVRDEDSRVKQYVAVFTDITAQKEHQRELERMAHFDALTGLPNRLLLTDRMQQAMAQSVRRGKQVIVAYLDLDDFKTVNNQFAHDVGDKLLVALGQRLSDELREGDTLARMGGDEFVAVLIDLDDTASVLPLISRLLAATSEPFRLDGAMVQTSASVGITSYPQGPEIDAEQLLRQADQAMYQAKLAGKNRYFVFDTQRDNDLRDHFVSVERIRAGLQHNEFVLYYQPKVNMRTGKVIGAEALIRWQHPERGLVPPGSFLPAIEDHLLSIALGEWVIEAAIRQNEAWCAAGLQVPVSVNVGALQLQQPDFVQRVRLILARHPAFDPANLQLEILETSAVRDLQQVTTVIEQFKQMGVDFALDDFGTGYSSLTYLRQLPVAVLKIDQSFVRNMLVNTEDQAILHGVLGLARAFGRAVIAEGVETEEHGTLLLQLGCDAAQGYGIARPMDGNAIPAWVQHWRPNPQWLNCVS